MQPRKLFIVLFLGFWLVSDKSSCYFLMNCKFCSKSYKSNGWLVKHEAKCSKSNLIYNELDNTTNLSYSNLNDGFIDDYDCDNNYEDI